MQIFQTSTNFPLKLIEVIITNTCNATNIDSPTLNGLLSISQLFYIIKKFIIK